MLRKGHVCHNLYYYHAPYFTKKNTGTSLTQYLQAIRTRGLKAVENIKLPKQIALFCAPKLYQPDRKDNHRFSMVSTSHQFSFAKESSYL